MSGGEEDRVLEWPDFTDGDSTKWPGPPLVRADMSSTSKTWLQRIGQAISTVLRHENPEWYRMRGWPIGYAVFSQARTDTARADYYLYGGPKRYRSAVEFQEHAIWLYFSGSPPSGYEPPLKSHLKKPRAIGAKATPPPKASTGSTTQVKNTTERPSAPEAPPKTSSPGKRVTFKNSTPPVAGPSNQTQFGAPAFNPESANVSVKGQKRKSRLSQPSLLTMAPKQGKESHKVYPTREQINRPGRTYRIGEVVWCIIEPNILNADSLVSIDQWPGLIEAYRVKKAVLAGDAITEDEFYHIKLLALNDTFVVPGSRLTPYKSFRPAKELISLMQSLPPPTPNPPSRLYHFHQNVSYLPVQHQEEELETPADAFIQATGPYALALQNAARLALSWGFVYPQIQGSDVDTWYRNTNMSFAGLWWGPELIYVGEMGILIANRAQLASHPITMAHVKYNDGDEGRAVILQIKRIEARSSVSKEEGGSRAFVIGVLYELVPLLSDTAADPVSTMPKQTAPLGMMWKQLLPAEIEVCVDVTLLSGRYYEDVSALPAETFPIRGTVASVLQGLVHGKYNRRSVPSSYYNTRAQMCRTEKKNAMYDLEQYWLGRNGGA